ncbi:hypothetical protein KQH56_01615 [bacterium]|nr:hypothetical protein [bacterium]
MFTQKKRLGVWIFIVSVCITTLGCNLLSSLGIGGRAGEPTPTPTMMPGGGELPPGENPCEGLSGSVDLQLLVGPSEAVGLEPYTLASVPFSVTRDGEVYLVEGTGQLILYEDVLEAQWGSFSVQFDGDLRLSGTCVGMEMPGTLNLYLELDGEQMVVIVVDGNEMTYPWSGTPTLTASLPIRDEAEQSGEGWTLVLHLD